MVLLQHCAINQLLQSIASIWSWRNLHKAQNDKSSDGYGNTWSFSVFLKLTFLWKQEEKLKTFLWKQEYSLHKFNNSIPGWGCMVVACSPNPQNVSLCISPLCWHSQCSKQKKKNVTQKWRIMAWIVFFHPFTAKGYDRIGCFTGTPNW